MELPLGFEDEAQVGWGFMMADDQSWVFLLRANSSSPFSAPTTISVNTARSPKSSSEKVLPPRTHRPIPSIPSDQAMIQI
jgi:hypothetical protein